MQIKTEEKTTIKAFQYGQLKCERGNNRKKYIKKDDLEISPLVIDIYSQEILQMTKLQ